jgi:hypothetical protein
MNCIFLMFIPTSLYNLCHILISDVSKTCTMCIYKHAYIFPFTSITIYYLIFKIWEQQTSKYMPTNPYSFMLFLPSQHLNYKQLKLFTCILQTSIQKRITFAFFYTCLLGTHFYLSQDIFWFNLPCFYPSNCGEMWLQNCWLYIVNSNDKIS